MFCIPKEIFMPQEYLDTLLCSLGKGILIDPVSLPCQHVFCRKCIEMHLLSNQQCPVCSSKGSIASLVAQPTFNELINMSLVRCPKCEWSGNYESYPEHEKKCSPNTVACPQGCGFLAIKIRLNQHMLECRLRKLFCADCNEPILYEEQLFHDEVCSRRTILCPSGCGEKFPVLGKSLHMEVCAGAKPTCPFEFSGCTFSDKNKEEANKGHQNQGFIDHLTMLGLTLSKLMSKANVVEHIPIVSKVPVPTIGSPLTVLWENGKKVISGKKVGWSFALSDRALNGNFMVRIKINNVNTTDTNGWKICLGLFTSNLYVVGSWGNYANGYGYILANGCKMHINGPEKYGQPYDTKDVITIEYRNKEVSFHKNGQSQGVAYKGVGTPCYLAVAISHKDHQVEIIEAAQLK